MKRIIVLSGVADCGKTSTLLSVINELENLGGKIKVCKISKPKSNPYPDKTVIIELNNQKIVFVTTGDAKYLIEKELLRVGIITAVDNKAIIEKQLNKISALECDILICATRSQGQSISFLKQVAVNNGCNVEIISKCKSKFNNENADNEEIAKQILNKLL